MIERPTAGRLDFMDLGEVKAHLEIEPNQIVVRAELGTFGWLEITTDATTMIRCAVRAMLAAVERHEEESPLFQDASREVQ